MNYKELERKDEKDNRVAILATISEFCQENSITYYLAFGTLLGAVREGGMIDWDYDIDVMMPRPDYERFIKIFKDDNFRVQYYALNKNYGGKLAIVEDMRTVNITDPMLNDNDPLKRISVELYPIDGTVENKIVFYLQEILLDFLGRCNTIKNISIDKRRKWYRNLLLGFLKLILFPVNNNTLVKIIHAIASYFKYVECDYSVISCIGYKFRDTRHKKNMYEEKSQLLYEGRYYFVPKNYDRWLASHYGDYMNPPSNKDIEYSLKLKNYYKYGLISN